MDRDGGEMNANKFGQRNLKGEIEVPVEAIGIHVGPVFLMLRKTVPNFSPEYNDLAAAIWKCGFAIAKERDAVIADLRDEIKSIQQSQEA